MLISRRSWRKLLPKSGERFDGVVACIQRTKVMELADKHQGLQKALIKFGLDSFLGNDRAPWIL